MPFMAIFLSTSEYNCTVSVVQVMPNIVFNLCSESSTALYSVHSLLRKESEGTLSNVHIVQIGNFSVYSNSTACV